MNDKVLITGATGLLGTDLLASLKRDYRTMGVSSSHFDIRSYDETVGFMNNMRPDIVLHAAAWADVDGCEKNRELAFLVNAEGTKNMARVCKDIGARLIYYSTDYVFDGTKGSAYTEDDTPNPINIYGRSKYEGEEYVLDILEDAAIVRISWLYGTAKSCFVTGVIKAALEQIRARQQGLPFDVIRAVSDQFSCPTWTVDIADQTQEIIEKKVSGVLHAAAIGELSRFKLAEHIFEELSWEVEMEPCKATDFPMKAPRPGRTPLENKRLNELGISIMRDYQESVREFLMVHKEE